MPDNDMRRPEDWYRSGALDTAEAQSWYGAAADLEALPVSSLSGEETPRYSTPGTELRPAPQGGTRRRGRAGRIIAVAVGVLALVCAACFGVWRVLSRVQIFVEEASGGRPPVIVPMEPELPFGDGFSAEDREAYDDFRDYFANTYGEPVELPRAETGRGVTLSLERHGREEMSLQDIYESVSPAVIGLTTYVDGYAYGWGTGVVFTPDGYIVTNTHILEYAESATASFPNGDTYDVKLVGMDSASDIAVLKIDGKNLPYVVFGSSDELRVGDAAIAIGNPLGEEYAGTMTNGIISAINRNVVHDGHRMTLVQTNAAINEGNSGGPLVNAYGQVIGITNMKIMGSYTATVEGIGFAVPSSVVKQVADELLAYGLVMGEPTIGITAAPVSDEAMMLYDLPLGVYVASVNENSDAMQKGLKEGDIILKVNGVDVASVPEINEIKEGLAVGDTLTLTVYRGGDVFDIDILLVDKSVIQ